MFDMFFDLGGELESQVFDGFVHFVLNRCAHEAVTVAVVHFQVVFGDFQIEVTSLVPVHEHDQVVDYEWWLMLLFCMFYLLFVPLKHNERMFDVNVLYDRLLSTVVLPEHEELVVFGFLFLLNVPIIDELPFFLF